MTYTVYAEAANFPFNGSDVTLTRYIEDIYSVDYENNYQKYSYNGNVFYGGRYVRNMLPWSEDMENGPNWTRTLVTVTNNAGTDPDGGNTATRVVGSAGSWILRDNNIVEVVSGDAGNTSMWIKSNTGSNQTFRLQIFGRTSSVLTASTSWQRFTNNNISVGNYYSGITRDAAGTAADILIWHPQVEFGLKSSEYIKTEDKPVYEVFANEYANTVSSNIVTEIVGNPLVQAPYLISQFSTTNEVSFARDLTQWTKSATATGTTTLTGTGLNNKPNTCTEMNITVAGAYYNHYEDITISSGDIVCTSVLVLKSGINGNIISELRFDTLTNQRVRIYIDLSTGTPTTDADDGSNVLDIEIVDRGLWWQFLVYTDDAYTSTSVRWLLYAAEDGSGDSLVGTTTFDAAQLYANKTIDEVKNLTPILTQGSTQTIADKFPNWDSSYHSEEQGLYYFEFFYSGGYYDLLKIGDNPLLRVAQIENINDELVDEQPSVTNWTIYGTNIGEDDEGALKITYVDIDAGAYTLLRGYECLYRDSIHDEKLFVKADIKISTTDENGTFNFVVKARGVNSIIPLYSTEFVTIITEAIISRTSFNPNIEFEAMSAGDIVWIKNLSIHSSLDGVEAVSGGTTSLPLINGENNKVAIAYGNEDLALNLNNRWADQTSFTPVSGDISTNGIIRELKHYNNSFATSLETIEDLM